MILNEEQIEIWWLYLKKMCIHDSRSIRNKVIFVVYELIHHYLFTYILKIFEAQALEDANKISWEGEATT